MRKIYLLERLGFRVFILKFSERIHIKNFDLRKIRLLQIQLFLRFHFKILNNEYLMNFDIMIKIKI